MFHLLNGHYEINNKLNPVQVQINRKYVKAFEHVYSHSLCYFFFFKEEGSL